MLPSPPRHAIIGKCNIIWPAQPHYIDIICLFSCLLCISYLLLLYYSLHFIITFHIFISHIIHSNYEAY